MLRSMRFAALTMAVSAAAMLAACANDATAPTSEIEAKNSGWDSGDDSQWDGSSWDGSSWDGSSSSSSQHGFLKCTPQPYAIDSAWIGSKGGEIKIGKNKFSVPKGALNQTTLITMELPSDTVLSARLFPEGLTFNPKARPKLTLDYAHSCGRWKGKASIVYTTDDLQPLQVLPSRQNDQDGDSQWDDVDSDLDHFSRYAVYY